MAAMPKIDPAASESQHRRRIVVARPPCSSHAAAANKRQPQPPPKERISATVARRLDDYQVVTVDSPAYFAGNGVPSTLADLDKNVAVNYFWGRHGRLMELTFVVMATVPA